MQKTHIHAYAGIEFVNGIDYIPEEGQIYAISNFSVADSKQNYSTVSNKKIIFFLKYTNMIRVEEDDEMIPRYKFELVAFKALKERVGDTKNLIGIKFLIFLSHMYSFFKIC